MKYVIFTIFNVLFGDINENVKNFQYKNIFFYKIDINIKYKMLMYVKNYTIFVCLFLKKNYQKSNFLYLIGVLKLL